MSASVKPNHLDFVRKSLTDLGCACFVNPVFLSSVDDSHLDLRLSREQRIKGNFGNDLRLEVIEEKAFTTIRHIKQGFHYFKHQLLFLLFEVDCFQFFIYKVAAGAATEAKGSFERKVESPSNFIESLCEQIRATVDIALIIVLFSRYTDWRKKQQLFNMCFRHLCTP